MNAPRQSFTRMAAPAPGRPAETRHRPPTAGASRGPQPAVSVKTIAVVGGSGAGKTWFVRRLCRVFGGAASHLSLDDFYRDRSHLSMGRRARLNFDIPDAIDWSDAATVLQHCRAGRPTALPAYDFATYSRQPARRSWEPRALVFADGLWLLRPAEMRPLFDLKLYLDTPTGLRLERRVARDTAERGYTAEAVRERLESMVLPMHARYVEPQKRHAHLVLSQPYREAEVAALAAALWPLVADLDLPVVADPGTLRQELLTALLHHEYAS